MLLTSDSTTLIYFFLTLFLDDNKNPVTKMKITLSYDGRAIDEEIASEFLEVIREMLEDPSVMLLGGQRGLREKLGL
jgi:hypothetical protein